MDDETGYHIDDMDKISVMGAFCRIVELNGFSKAAGDLGVSPALLSREIKLLEESLGCVLIARTTRSMSLTEHGALYYAEARRLLAELDGLDNVVRDGVDVLKGALRINAPLSFGLSVLSPLLPAFMSDYPDLNIALNFDDRVLDMVEGGYDLSIRIRAELPDSGLVAQRIGTVHQALFAAPTYLQVSGRPAAPDDLKDHRLLAFSLADDVFHWPLSGPDGDTDVPINPKTAVSNSIFLRDLLIAGQGIGALPSFIYEPAVKTGALECVLPEYSLPPRRIYAVIAHRLSADAKTRTFVDFLRHHLSEAGFG